MLNNFLSKKIPKMTKKINNEEQLKDLLKVITILRNRFCDFHHPREEIDEYLKKRGFCGECYLKLEKCLCPSPDSCFDSETDDLDINQPVKKSKTEHDNSGLFDER